MGFGAKKLGKLPDTILERSLNLVRHESMKYKALASKLRQWPQCENLDLRPDVMGNQINEINY